MPRFLSPIYVKHEIVTGNETISGNETILGVTSGKNSYWTTVNSELSVSSDLGYFNTLSSNNLNTINIGTYSLSSVNLSSSFINSVVIDSLTGFYQTLTASNIISDNFIGDGSKLTGVIASGGIATDSTKLPLSGGILTGDLTIFGSITALSGSTFVNTIFTTTSALSIINIGLGPALYVLQGSGAGDVASFYDGDGVEVLHIGNALNPISDGVIGIKTSFPNKTLTVIGDISATDSIWSNDFYGNADNLSSVKWDSSYTIVNSNSSTWNLVTILSTTTTDLINLTSNFENTYNTVNSNSAQWGVTTDNNKLPLSGGIITGDLTVNGTFSTVNTDNWQSAYTTLSSNSASYITLTGTQTLTNKTVIDWMTLVRGYNTTPTLLTSLGNGDVYSYIYNSSPSNITYYRFIATDGSEDKFYSYFSGNTLSGLIASKSIFI
jgi:hypothetical protein